jgi:GMP synthase (glutamine-hydrolysing)
MYHVIDFGSTKVPLIQAMIEINGHSTTVHPWETVDPETLINAEGIVLSGSPTFLTEVDHRPYMQQCGFLKHLSIPVLGICFGHQILGILHGAKIYRGPEVREPNLISVLQPDPLFEELGKQTRMTEDHTEGITLPEGFIHLASSESYFNEGMKHPSRKIWGVQFHPEVSGVNGIKFFRNFCGLRD